MAHGNACILVYQLAREDFDGHSGHESLTGVSDAKGLDS